MNMGRTTGIGWTNSTINFWIGCKKVSPGCKHCYAESLVTGRMARPFWPPWRTTTAYWRQPYQWKEHRMIFTCSLSDFFVGAEEGAPDVDAWRMDAWKVIKETPQHTWQILTKRPELIRKKLPPDWGPEGYPNVWLGATVEMQMYAEERIASLLDVPAALHYVSAEPALTKLDLSRYLGPTKVAWVILGGESQKGARPMDPEWARMLRDQARDAKVPFFFKQIGGYPDAQAHEKALLDGALYTEMPEVRAIV